MLIGLLASLTGCASSFVPPTVTILGGRLVSASLLDQQLQMVLCVANPNNREIALSRVSFQVVLADDVLAKGVSEAPFVIPSHGAVPLPFAVATTMRNLGSPLQALFTHGSIDYVVSGHVLLRDFTLLGIPYSIQGRLTPATVAGDLFEMATAGTPPASPCSGP